MSRIRLASTSVSVPRPGGREEKDACLLFGSLDRLGVLATSRLLLVRIKVNDSEIGLVDIY